MLINTITIHTKRKRGGGLRLFATLCGYCCAIFTAKQVKTESRLASVCALTRVTRIFRFMAVALGARFLVW